MLLHEVVVHQISHTPWTKAPNLILGKGLKGLPHAGLNVPSALGGSIITIKQSLHGTLQASLDGNFEPTLV
jgi:hypothetical protein